MPFGVIVKRLLWSRASVCYFRRMADARPDTPLGRYLSSRQESVREFAARSRIHERAIRRIAAGTSRPRADTARRIVDATGGTVTWQDLAPLDGVNRAAP